MFFFHKECNIFVRHWSNIIFDQHCGYWWPGAEAPGHQQPQCWVPVYAIQAVYGLSHWGRVTHICISKLYRPSLVQIMAFHLTGAKPLYPNQYWHIVNWTFGNKFQWNSNQNTTISVQEYEFENYICEVSSILSRPQCVKGETCCINQHHNELVKICTCSQLCQAICMQNNDQVHVSTQNMWDWN